MLRNFLLYVLTLLITLTIIFVMGELVVRIFAPQAILPRFVESAPYGIRKVIGDVEARHETTEYQYLYTTNSEGFRGKREYTVEKPENIFRIVVQGDSVTLGHGVPDDQTFAHLLERRLAENGVQAEVINMGVSGFGTAEEIIQFENVARQYNPDLVILGYFQNDDLNNHVSKLYTFADGSLRRESATFQPGLYLRDRLYKIPFYSFLSQRSHLFTFVRSQASRLILQGLEEESQGKLSAPEAQSESASGKLKQASELTRALLLEYADEVTSTGAKLIILSIVDKRFTTDLPLNLPFGDGVLVIRTKTEFEHRAEAGERLFYDIDAHPTTEGHALLADILYRSISEAEFIDGLPD